MSLEANKIFAAVLIAGIAAMSSGFVADLLFPDETHGEAEEKAYKIAAVSTGDQEAAPAQEEEQLASVLPLLASGADPDDGQSLSRACQACHSFEEGGPHKVGPNLWNIVNAPPASKEGYSYSSALLELDIDQWTYEELNAFLANPRDYAPGTKMSYGGLRKVEDRANMIAWLRTLSDTPPPLPSPSETAQAETTDESTTESESESQSEAGDSQESGADAPSDAGDTVNTDESGASDDSSQSEENSQSN